MKLVLLPGMDGTGKLFAPFVEVLHADFSPLVISYPKDQAWGYAQLLAYVRNQLPEAEDFVLLGESFSGPLALQIAEGAPKNMRALILACTFQDHPRPFLAPLSALVGVATLIRPPLALIQSVLTNGAGSFEVAKSVQQAVSEVSGTAFKARVNALNTLSKNNNRKPIHLPCLYLQATRDRVVPASCFYSLLQRMPNLKLKKIAGPHCLLQVNPTDCSEAVEAFLKSIA